MKVELGVKIITKFVGPKVKTYSYLIDDVSEVKKSKGRKKCIIKRNFKFEIYINCLESTQLENKTNNMEKSQTDIDSLKKVINNS